MMNQTLCFLGGGHMATSLIHGLIQSGYSKDHILVSDPNPEKRTTFENKFKIKTFDNNLQAAEQANILILSVKPKDVLNVVNDIKFVIQAKKPLVISIAAGITTRWLHKQLGNDIAIVRAMPNTGALLQIGATGLYADGKVSEEQRSLAESILRSVGIIVWLNHEHDLDTVTALSGSGPAYFFVLMDALQQAATRLGLSAEVAKILTLQTALGAARMALESEISLESLIHRVASKGGTTEAALQVLEQGNIQGLIENTLKAAKKRSEELSESF